MPAEVYGYLKEDATYGEKGTYELLKANLPKEYSVFVEPPVHKHRENRYPDFVVLTNYGVIILEVKDWVNIERADPSGATIRTRGNETRFEYNPVTKARDFALALSQNLKDKYNENVHKRIPWGYAAVLYNLHSSTISQIRGPWGEEFVFSRFDLENPDVLAKRLRETIRADRMVSLTSEDIDFVRSVIYPSVEFVAPNKPAVIIDPIQTKLVSEKPAEPVKQKPASTAQTPAFDIFATTTPLPQSDPIPDTPSAVAELFENTSVRLVRGLAGSGKTLVLIQRAKFLADQHPEKKILVLSYNKTLASNLRANFTDYAENIKTTHFHSLCKDLLGPLWKNADNPTGWVEKSRANYPDLSEYSTEFLGNEITWIKDMGISNLQQYLTVERKGRGRENRLTKEPRSAIYRLLEDYNTGLVARNLVDFADIPHLVLAHIESGAITPPPYDVVMLDEAQDFAPSWIKVVTKILAPKEGIIFLADDPTQSIYKQYSWREKGIPVVGRTVRLTVPYRNTYQIFKLANDLVKDDPVLTQRLKEEDVNLNPEIPQSSMRQGEKPLLVKRSSIVEEADFILLTMKDLISKHHLNENQFVVLTRTRKTSDRLKEHIRNAKFPIATFHAYKGMECEVVFLCGLQETFGDDLDENQLAEEKKLVYMAMTRARQKLYMTYQTKLPKEIRNLSENYDQI